jgi:hypothetical protein
MAGAIAGVCDIVSRLNRIRGQGYWMKIEKISLSIAQACAVAALGIFLLPLYASVAHASVAAPGEGLVVFHRADVMKGKAIRFDIKQDGRPIGRLSAGDTMEVPLAPGTYTFSVSAISVDGYDTITLNVEAGKTYSVQGEILWGWPAGRAKFSTVTESGTASVSPKSPATVPEATSPRPSMSADDAGRVGLRNFVGDWNMRMWSLAADGSELEGRGVAKAMLEGDNAVSIVITEFDAPDFPIATGGGRVLIAYEAGRGFSLQTNFQYSDEILKLTGGYEAESNKYVFYLVGGPGGQTATGIERTSVRLEIRALDMRSWTADTFADVDGRSTQVQSTRFSRR